jgi:trehalose/maltose transport system substrate-binding protein
VDDQQQPSDAQRQQELLGAFADGRVSRRTFMMRAAVLGLSASAVGAFLAACGGGSATTGTGASTAPSTAPSTAASTAPSTAASTAPSTVPSAAPSTGASVAPSTGASAAPSVGASAAPSSTAVATRTVATGVNATATRAGSPVASPSATSYTRENPPAVANATAAKAFSGQKVTYIGGQVGTDADFDKILAGKFQQDTGIQLNVVPGPAAATERYAQYQRTFQGQSADIDVMMIDVIWPAAFAPFLTDLNPKLGDQAKLNVQGILTNNTVDGKLVGMPWFGDFGVLYYRKDLLQKYNIAAPPKTWQELQTQAKTIQDGERGANPNFAGFVFQGNAYEGLTCNSLEWLASNGAGQFVDGNNVNISSPAAAAVLNLIKGFVGTISPRGVTTYQEDETLQAFTGGNAAFARNWPYMYSVAGGTSSQVAGKFDVAALPAASGQKPVGTVGGWQLGVSKFSKAQDASIEFIRYMCSPDVVAWRGTVGSYVPLQQGVLDNPAVQAAQPYLKNLADVVRVTRPSNALGENYNQGSTVIFQAVNQVLNGGDATQQLQSAQSQLQRLLRRS